MPFNKDGTPDYAAAKKVFSELGSRPEVQKAVGSKFKAVSTEGLKFFPASPGLKKELSASPVFGNK